MRESGARKLDATVHPFPLEHLADAELVRDVAAGNGDALAAVWHRYAGQIRRTLLGCLGSTATDQVDDLVQEVFVGLHRNAKYLQDPTRLRSYLIGAAIKKARQTIRDRSRRRRLLSLFAHDQQTAASPAVQSRDAVRRLREILGSLPARYREAFILRYVEDLSMAEIAEIRDTSLATAKRDVTHARERVVFHAERELALQDYLRSTMKASPEEGS